MVWEINWTEPAKRNLRKIHAYLQMKAPFAIETVMALIHEKIKGLKDSPFKGEIYGEYESGTLRETLAGRFRIFFVIDEDAYRVDILRIWHSSRDEPDFED